MTLEERKAEVATTLAELVDWLAEADPDESRLYTARVVVRGCADYLRDEADDVAERPVLRLVKRDDSEPEPEAA